MSIVVLPLTAWSVDFGLVTTRTSGTGWKYVPRSPIGLSPAFLNSAAIYSVARNSPRLPGPRPSRRSLARYATWALIRSAEILGRESPSAASKAHPRMETTKSSNNRYATGCPYQENEAIAWAVTRLSVMGNPSRKRREPALDRIPRTTGVRNRTRMRVIVSAKKDIPKIFHLKCEGLGVISRF